MSCRGYSLVAVTTAAAAAIAATTLAQSAPPGGAFSVKVEAVRVDVLVTNGGSVVRGLTPADFEVLDNGVPQQVDLVSFEQIPLNVILALDMSDSVAGERLTQLQGASGALLSALEPDDQAALVTFSQQVRLVAPLSKNLVAVREGLAASTGSGGTALVDGIYTGTMIGESDVGRALLIVFSDGVDTASWLTGERLIESIKRSDTVVYAVSVRSRVKAELLSELTSLTGGRLHEVEKTQNVERTFLDILNEFRMRYLVSYTPRSVAKDGWHRLDVRIKGRRATVRARPGYLAGS